MKHPEPMSPAPPYTGHVKNGVVVLDSSVNLAEGQAVCVHPVVPGPTADSDRVQTLKRLFDEWTAEDAGLTDAEADALGRALEANGRTRFRSPDLT